MRVGIIGTGKVAHQLAYAIHASEEADLICVIGRKASKAKQIIEKTSCIFLTDYSEIPKTDLLIIAIKDDAIEELSTELPATDALLVHTSGIKDLNVLKKHERRGILYPLYSFYSTEKISLKGVPFLVESNSAEDAKLLQTFAHQLSGNSHEISAKEKEQLHVAAVFANNFTNHMMTRAFDLLDVKSLDKEILLPIIKQSCLNWMEGNAKNHQSGPALRNDKQTLKTHLEKLNDKQSKELYTLISESILKYYS